MITEEYVALKPDDERDGKRHLAMQTVLLAGASLEKSDTLPIRAVWHALINSSDAADNTKAWLDLLFQLSTKICAVDATTYYRDLFAFINSGGPDGRNEVAEDLRFFSTFVDKLNDPDLLCQVIAHIGFISPSRIWNPEPDTVVAAKSDLRLIARQMPRLEAMGVSSDELVTFARDLHHHTSEFAKLKGIRPLIAWNAATFEAYLSRQLEHNARRAGQAPSRIRSREKGPSRPASAGKQRTPTPSAAKPR